MDGDPPVGSAADRPERPVSPDCPVECLALLLPVRVLNRLARAVGRHGQVVAPCEPPATVGDLARIYREGRLGEIAGIGVQAITQIVDSLAFAGLDLGGAGTLARQHLHACQATPDRPALREPAG